MKAKAVIFDLGNVFVDVDLSKALERLHAHRDAGADTRAESAIAERLLHGLERGELTTTQFHEAVCRHGNLSIDLTRFCAIYCDIFAPIDEMIEAQAALRRRGVPTYIFSNTSELHFNHICSRYGFMSGFAGYFLSYEIGSEKPEADAYAAVEDGTGLNGSDLLYIDDRLENVEAGAARGWTTIHHTAPRSTVSKLREMGLV